MTVWYDFTTTIRNRGRSGIASAEWNIGQALLEVDPSVRCFESVARGGLVELDPAVRLAGAVYASSGAAAPIVANTVPTWRDQLRSSLRSRFGRRADPFIRALSTVYQSPSRVRRRLRDGRPSSTAPGPGSTRLTDVVRSDDVVISMGADWDGQLAERLADLKSATGCTVVTMVYDLVPLTHTHLAFHNDPALFTRYYRALVEVSDIITCISDQSRSDLLDFAVAQGLPVRRAEVLLLGESEPDDVARLDRDEYYLCVGTVERRKNLELVYDALRILESEHRTVPRVVVAGARGWGNDDFLDELESSTTIAARSMILLGAVDDDTLDRLYRTARGLLFPSLFEGWGLPVREAAVRGCPVAVSDSPAIRQAAAGYAGATVLPRDDAGAWADFLARGPDPSEPAPRRPWSTVALDLLAVADERDPSAPRPADGASQSAG